MRATLAGLVATRESTLERVLAFWRAKQAVDYATFRQMEDAVRLHAFSTAFNFSQDLMTDVAKAIGDAIEKGEDVRGFRDRLDEVLARFGAGKASDLPPWRLNLLFRQNWINASNAGRYAGMFSADGVAEAELWRFRAIHDRRVDDPCLKLDGSVFRKSDVDARRYLPPIHFQCRCYTEDLTDEARAERGLELSKGTDFLEAGLRPDDGFDFDKATPFLNFFAPKAGVVELPDVATVAAPVVSRIDAFRAAVPEIDRVEKLEAQQRAAEDSMRAFGATRMKLYDELGFRGGRIDYSAGTVEFPADATRYGAYRLPEFARLSDADVAKAYEEAVARQNLASADWRRIRAAWEELSANVRRKADDWLRLPAAERTRFETTTPSLISSRSKVGRSLKEGLARFRELVSEKVLRESSSVKMFTTERKGRSFFRRLEGIFLSKDASPSVVAHELGHFLEERNSTIRANIVAFLERRTAGESPRRLRDLVPGAGYRVGELARPDKFLDPYVGKVYADASEVLSMGIQWLIEDPVKFALGDPEMFDFIVGLVRGEIT